MPIGTWREASASLPDPVVGGRESGSGRRIAPTRSSPCGVPRGERVCQSGQTLVDQEAGRTAAYLGARFSRRSLLSLRRPGAVAGPISLRPLSTVTNGWIPEMGTVLSDRHLLSREVRRVFTRAAQVSVKTPREGVTPGASEGPALARRKWKKGAGEALGPEPYFREHPRRGAGRAIARPDPSSAAGRPGPHGGGGPPAVNLLARCQGGSIEAVRPRPSGWREEPGFVREARLGSLAADH